MTSSFDPHLWLERLIYIQLPVRFWQPTSALLISFQVGQIVTKLKFYVKHNLNWNVMFGSDWLVENGVYIYYDLGALGIKREYNRWRLILS